ncbi:MAG: ATP-binding protein [Oscillospiraceae bacterium]|nr:ATP-binding protein [Oscillospiraceae bacterium]
MKKLPLGVQNFRKIVEGDYVYVDKTNYVYDIINKASYYFLSRPRRFGKSLLLDTIAEAFSGDKELFKGLYIYDTDYSFERHPVIRLDMSNIVNRTSDTLESALREALLKQINSEGFDISSSLSSDLFKNLIMELHEKYGKRVVVLIDEYDKPMLDQLNNIEVAEANRDVLRDFYGILKSMDPHLQLTFLTGVTKFTKTSVFSGLNNLLDITLMEDYANVCGIEVDALDCYFSEHIDDLASQKNFKCSSSLRDEILAWYDGYSWDGETKLINPFSLLSLFMKKRIYSFWYASGTPSFLIKLLKDKPSSYMDLDDLDMSESALDSVDIRKMSAAPLLFQAGYLTVESVNYDPPPAYYKLRMPNLEVKEAFNLNIISEFTESDYAFTESSYRKLKQLLQSGNLEGILSILKSLFASIPHQLHVNREAYYHSIFYAIMTILGFDIEAEISVSGGRIDATLELADNVYVMEFKYLDCPVDVSADVKRNAIDKALDAGMAQIVGKGYANKFKNSNKTVRRAVLVFTGRDEIEMRVE